MDEGGSADSGSDVVDTAPPFTAPFTAVVTGSTPEGRPVVTSDRGAFLLQALADLPVGSRLTLAAADTPVNGAAGGASGIDLRYGQDWPALREALALLAAIDPGLATRLGATVPPRADDHFTLAITRFLAALKAGGLADWLGADAVATLNRRNPRLGALLARDFQAVALQAAEPGKDGWRTIAVPFGDEVARLHLHVRPVGEEEEREEKRGGGRQGRSRRFMLELTFSRLGPMQFDGMLWPQRFDLAVRTRALLPSALTRELHGIYANSLQALGYSGALSFQTGAHAWLDLRQAGPSSHKI